RVVAGGPHATFWPEEALEHCDFTRNPLRARGDAQARACRSSPFGGPNGVRSRDRLPSAALEGNLRLLAKGDPVDLLDRLDARIDRQHLLQHSFYRKWMAGTLPTSALEDYACQYFTFESTFPRFLSALHARCERADMRAHL